MKMSSLHEKIVVIDGLIVSDFGRGIFEDMRKGGITAANCTCCVWENFTETMQNIAKWKTWFHNDHDLITQVFTTDDIIRAKREGKTGIILGWQNTSAIEDRTGCYEGHDGGLSDFGRDVVAEMNRLGILCDLSHVGAKTSEDVILASKQRVAYSHCLPAGLKKHQRNKSDEQLRFIAKHDGFVGVTMFTPFLKKGGDSVIDDYVEAIEYVIDLVGEDKVGVGTDFTQGYDKKFFDWITHDKGFGRKLTDFGPIENPAGFRTIGEFPNLTAAMERRQWSPQRIEKVMGGNWLQLLKDVWRK
jgi:membrane dipeptidase